MTPAYQAQSKSPPAYSEVWLKLPYPAATSAFIHSATVDALSPMPDWIVQTAGRPTWAFADLGSVSPATNAALMTAVRAMVENRRALDIESPGELRAYQIRSELKR